MAWNFGTRKPLAAVLGAVLTASLATSAWSVDSGGSASSTENEAGLNIPVEMAKARTRIDAGRYRNAITVLTAVVKADSSNADAYNLLGFASRKIDRLKNAARYYDRALVLNASHLGALEYQGELFLMLGQPDKANANLAALLRLCGGVCEEYLDLKSEIASHGGT